MVMGDFFERLNYINDKIDEVYADIKKNYGYKTELESTIKAYSIKRHLISIFELLTIALLAAVTIKAFVDGNGLYTLIKYGIPCVIAMIIYYKSMSRYSELKDYLEVVERREQGLEEALDILKKDREKLLSGEIVALHSYEALSDIKIPQKPRGLVSAAATIALASVCLIGLSSLDYKALSPALRTVPFVSLDEKNDENNAGEVLNDEDTTTVTDDKKSVSLPGKFSQGALNGDKISLDFNWSYDFAEWTERMEVSEKSYEIYKNKSRSMIGMDYKHYIYDEDDDAFIKKLADSMCSSAENQGYDELGQLEVIISFVQSLDYIKDLDEDGNEIEYPKYPIETLVDGGGDCEDTCILLASLLRARGYGVAIICLSDHVAVGIKGDAVEGIGSYYEYGGNKYYYIETTAENWPIGEIPDDYKGKQAEVVVIE